MKKDREWTSEKCVDGRCGRGPGVYMVRFAAGRDAASRNRTVETLVLQDSRSPYDRRWSSKGLRPHEVSLEELNQWTWMRFLFGAAAIPGWLGSIAVAWLEGLCITLFWVT